MLVDETKQAELQSTKTVADLYQFWEKERAPDLRKNTVDNYKRIWKNCLEGTFGCRRADSLKRAEILSFYSQFRERPAYGNRVLAFFKAIFHFAEYREVFTLKEKIFRVKTVKEEFRRRTIESHEGEVFFRELEKEPPLFQAYVKLLCLTGSRAYCELFPMQASWITDHGVNLPESKTRKGGEFIILSPEAREILRGVLSSLPSSEGASDTFLFLGPNRLGSPRKFYRHWRGFLERCGIKGLQCRDLRRHTASTLLSNGIALEEIGQLLRHRNYNTTKRYSVLDQNKAIKTLSEMSGKLIKKP